MWSDESLRSIEHKLQRLVLEKKYPKCSLLFKISYINVMNVWKNPPLVTSSFAEDWITYRSMQNDLGYPFYLRSLLANDLWHRKTPEPAKNPFHGCHESSKNSSTSKNFVCWNMNYTPFNAEWFRLSIPHVDLFQQTFYRVKQSMKLLEIFEVFIVSQEYGSKTFRATQLHLYFC